jgi:hypothetical protein
MAAICQLFDVRLAQEGAKLCAGAKGMKVGGVHAKAKVGG